MQLALEARQKFLQHSILEFYDTTLRILTGPIAMYLSRAMAIPYQFAMQPWLKLVIFPKKSS